MRPRVVSWLAFLAVVFSGVAVAAAEWDEAIESALQRSGDNQDEIRRALQSTPADQQAGIQFLVANMPDRDLQSLSAEFLVQNVAGAYQAWREAPWGDDVPEDVFLNSILPYANVTEPRDNWRDDFRKRFLPMVSEARSPSEAAAMLNNKLFPATGVKYSTKRRRTDAGPHETIETRMATCTGLSILLIDACRAVGVPARFVGIPMWTDNSGNHSWVEVWDDGWHFTGAAEPTGMALDQGWFVDRAAAARGDEPRHAIYAASFKRTPFSFPCSWAPRSRDVYATNVTARYTARREELPAGMARVMFAVVDSAVGERRAAPIRVESPAGELLFEGTTRGEGFDTNDHVTATAPLGGSVVVIVAHEPKPIRKSVRIEESGQLVVVDLAAAGEVQSPEDADAANAAASASGK